MDYSELSTGKSIFLYGFEIKRLPIGAYIKAIKKLSGVKLEVFKKCFPDMTFVELLEHLNSLRNEGLYSLLCAALDKAPKAVIEVISELTGVDAKRIIEDGQIGLCGLLEIINAFIEVNELKKCLRLYQKITS